MSLVHAPRQPYADERPIHEDNLELMSRSEVDIENHAQDSRDQERHRGHMNSRAEEPGQTEDHPATADRTGNRFPIDRDAVDDDGPSRTPRDSKCITEQPFRVTQFCNVLGRIRHGVAIRVAIGIRFPRYFRHSGANVYLWARALPPA